LGEFPATTKHNFSLKKRQRPTIKNERRRQGFGRIASYPPGMILVIKMATPNYYKREQTSTTLKVYLQNSQQIHAKEG
jgi:hypothetical protein